MRRPPAAGAAITKRSSGRGACYVHAPVATLLLEACCDSYPMRRRTPGQKNTT